MSEIEDKAGRLAEEFERLSEGVEVFKLRPITGLQAGSRLILSLHTPEGLLLFRSDARLMPDHKTGDELVVAFSIPT